MASTFQQSGSPRQNIPLNPTMFWTIEYVKESHFARVEVSGIYNIEDHMLMLEDLVSRNFWKPGTNCLLDESSLSYQGTTLEQLREAAARRIKMDAAIGAGKTAVVMSTLTNFARARQYELITSGKVSAKIDIFKSDTEALNWLLA